MSIQLNYATNAHRPNSGEIDQTGIFFNQAWKGKMNTKAAEQKLIREGGKYILWTEGKNGTDFYVTYTDKDSNIVHRPFSLKNLNWIYKNGVAHSLPADIGVEKLVEEIMAHSI